ncbi:MAG: glycosyltransferase [Nitrospirae bacterium]|nr:glycosyltransferase [Nitrospirota bacterium]
MTSSAAHRPASKPVLLWAFWPDDLSRALEKFYRIAYLQIQAAPATLANYHLPSILESVGKGQDRPVAFFLHGWALCDSLLDLDHLGIPSVAYFHDTHFHLNSWAWDFSHVFDRVYLDTQGSVEYFIRRGSTNDVAYCPLYYKGARERVSSFDPGRERPIDVAFVGNWDVRLHPERHRFFQELLSKVGTRYRLHVGAGEFESVYPSSKIVINETAPPPAQRQSSESVVDAPNFRVFEAMGCGAMLLCDSPAPSVRALFEEGEDFVAYRHADAADAMDRIERYLRHGEERLAIAYRGWRRVVEQHTPEARAEMIAPALQDLIERRGLPVRNRPEHKFLLGRGLLRQALVWRWQAPSMGDPAFGRRIATACRLLSEGTRSEKYGPLAAALLPLLPYLVGKVDEAIEGWRKLRGTASHSYAAPFLAACATLMDGMRAEVEAFGEGPEAILLKNAAEVEVYREILGGSVFQKPKS